MLKTITYTDKRGGATTAWYVRHVRRGRKKGWVEVVPIGRRRGVKVPKRIVQTDVLPVVYQGSYAPSVKVREYIEGRAGR